jgi:hypothetical protein
MQVARSTAPLSQLTADALVVGLFSEEKPAGAAELANQASGGLLSRLIEAKELSGKLYELTPLYGSPACRH